MKRTAIIAIAGMLFALSGNALATDPQVPPNLQVEENLIKMRDNVLQQIVSLRQRMQRSGPKQRQALEAAIQSLAVAEANLKAQIAGSRWQPLPLARCFCVKLVHERSHPLQIINQGTSPGCFGRKPPSRRSGLLNCEDLKQCDKLIPYCATTKDPRCQNGSLDMCYVGQQWPN